MIGMMNVSIVSKLQLGKTNITIVIFTPYFSPLKKVRNFYEKILILITFSIIAPSICCTEYIDGAMPSGYSNTFVELGLNKVNDSFS